MNTPKKSSAIMEELNLWLSHLENQGRSPRTVRTYRDALFHLITFLAQRKIYAVADVEVRHLTSWSKQLSKSGCRTSTINQYVRTVQLWFGWQVATDRLFYSPAALLQRPKPARTFGRCPTEAEICRLLSSVDGTTGFDLRDRALLELAYSTGARCEEIVRLDLTSVDLTSRSVVLQGKGDKDRVVPLAAPAVRALAAYAKLARPTLLRGREDESAYFLGQRGGRRLETPAVAEIIRRRGAKIRLVISPHDFRRAFCTHLANHGASLAHVKDMLGHVGYRHLHHYLAQTPADALATVRNSPLNR